MSKPKDTKCMLILENVSSTFDQATTHRLLMGSCLKHRAQIMEYKIGTYC